MHEQVSQQGRDWRTLRGPFLPGDRGLVWHLHGGTEPPCDVEQNPALVGVVSNRLQQQIMRNAVEEGPDVQIDHPVLPPTTPTRHSHRVEGGTAPTVAVAVGVEDRLKLVFQQHRCRGLGDPVGHTRHAEHPDPRPMIFRYLHRPHRPGKIAPRTHPVPQCEQVVLLIVCEIGDAYGVHARRPLIGPDLLPRPEHEALINLKRLHLQLRSTHQLLPRKVGITVT